MRVVMEVGVSEGGTAATLPLAASGVEAAGSSVTRAGPRPCRGAAAAATGTGVGVPTLPPVGVASAEAAATAGEGRKEGKSITPVDGRRCCCPAAAAGGSGGVAAAVGLPAPLGGEPALLVPDDATPTVAADARVDRGLPATLAPLPLPPRCDVTGEALACVTEDAGEPAAGE